MNELATRSRRRRLKAHAWRWTRESRDRRRHLRTAYAAGLLPAARATAKFAIVTVGRAGSQLLIEALDQHPLVCCEGEVLDPSLLAPGAPRLFLRGQARLAARRGARAYGFKLPLTHLTRLGVRDPRLFFEDLAADGFTFIHLARRSLLRQALSTLVAIESGVWARRVNEGSVERHRIVVDPTALISNMCGMEAVEESIRTFLAGLPTRKLWYEDDLATADIRQRTLDTVIRDLGLEPFQVRPDFHKLAPPTLQESIANLEEVLEVLSRTRFGVNLDDELRLPKA